MRPTLYATVLGLAVAAALAFWAARKSPPASPPPVPYAVGVTCGSRAWLPEWNEHVATGVRLHGANLLLGEQARSDITALCPGFFTASPQERVAFWALFVASVACPESGYNPDSVYNEPPPLSKPSEGLLQLSYGDERGHPECKLNKSAGNIRDPKVNLECGVAVLNRQVGKGLGLFTAQNYYWSVLGPKNGGAKVKAHFARYVAQLKFCGAGT